MLSSGFAGELEVELEAAGATRRTVVTSTLSSASITTRGAGIGTIGPIISVSWMPLQLSGIADSGHAFGQRDAQRRADGGDQRLGLHRAVRIAQAP